MVPTGLHGKHLQAVYTLNARSWSASSSSCDGDGESADMAAAVIHPR